MARVSRPSATPDLHADATAASTAVPPASVDDDELEILAPGVTITLDGDEITVREYTFGEQLRHGELLSALVETLRPILPRLTAPGGAEVCVELLDALNAHGDKVLAAMALSIDRPPEWVASLKGADGEALALTWWRVNRGFFERRLLLYPELAAAAHKMIVAGQDGPPSSPFSSTTDTPRAN